MESYEKQNNTDHYSLLQGVQKLVRVGGNKEKR